MGLCWGGGTSKIVWPPPGFVVALKTSFPDMIAVKTRNLTAAGGGQTILEVPPPQQSPIPSSLFI